jgi:hypothetical protein
MGISVWSATTATRPDVASSKGAVRLPLPVQAAVVIISTHKTPVIILFIFYLFLIFSVQHYK